MGCSKPYYMLVILINDFGADSKEVFNANLCLPGNKRVRN